MGIGKIALYLMSLGSLAFAACSAPPSPPPAASLPAPTATFVSIPASTRSPVPSPRATSAPPTASTATGGPIAPPSSPLPPQTPAGGLPQPAQPQDPTTARQTYPPNITQSVLNGRVAAPPGLDTCLLTRMSAERLKELRAGGMPNGVENDIAALCLASLKVPPESLQIATKALANTIKATLVTSQYRVSQTKPKGWFTNGQDADLVLAGFDFGKTGGPLMFDHPGVIATDGTHLILPDTFNNRVLIWNTPPTGNTPPDLVLGQKDFSTNNPGSGPDQLSWPMSATAAKGKLAVADTNNDRILIWNTFPTRDAQPADIIIKGVPRMQNPDKKRMLNWPWGVWTDGVKFAATSTEGGIVLIWNSLPTRNDQAADLYLTGEGKIGTPRGITSDGTHLTIGDHNARVAGAKSAGNFFWDRFPTRDDEPFSFYRESQFFMQGTFAQDGKLALMGDVLYVWNAFPRSASVKPDLQVGTAIRDRSTDASGYFFNGGDGSGIAIAGGRYHISSYNGNRIVVYNSLPTKTDQLPDYAIGSPDIRTNTLDTNYFVTNGNPVTDGKTLFVVSDFDAKLYIWKSLPDESTAQPDWVYTFPFQPNAIALAGTRLVVAGLESVAIWNKLPLDGELPDTQFLGSIGNAKFGRLFGAALDDKNFLLADRDAGKVYVWEGIPRADTNPKFTLTVEGVTDISSNGKYLVTTAQEAPDFCPIRFYRLSDLNAKPTVLCSRSNKPGELPRFNLPGSARVFGDVFVVADTSFNRVLIWKNIEDALAGRLPDNILGAKNVGDMPPKLIGKNTLFMPGKTAFDGSFLWVGEFKFSHRLLRFSVR